MNKQSIPQLRRKIERLEAQLAALQEFMQRDRKAEYETIRRCADMTVRMDQAVAILTGEER